MGYVVLISLCINIFECLLNFREEQDFHLNYCNEIIKKYVFIK